MKKINIGDTVAMIKDGEIIEGVVKRIVDAVNPPIMAVDFDGDIAKVSAKSVMLVQKSETKDEPESEKDADTNEARPTAIRCTKDRYSEVLKKVTVTDITIPRDDFRKALIVTNCYKAAIAIGFKVAHILFRDKEEIELDKYMLLWELVNELVPSKLAETAGVGDAYDFEALSGALIDIFMNLITELFGAEND